MGIDNDEIKDYLDSILKQLKDISYIDLSIGHISEQLEEIKDLLEKILVKIK